VSQLGSVKVSGMTEEFTLTPIIGEFGGSRLGLSKGTTWCSFRYSQNVEIAKKLGLRFCGMDLTVKMGSSWWLYALRDGRFFELSCQLREENFTVESAVVRALFWVNDKGYFYSDRDY